MMRVLGILTVALLVFVGTVVAFLGLNNQLSTETFARFIGREPEPVPALAEDPIGPWAKRLQEEEDRLAAWESELETWETRLSQRESDLSEIRREIVQRQEQLKAQLDQLETVHSERVKEVADSIAAMDEDEAAKVMETFPPEEAAEILRQIQPRTRGKILDAMNQDQRAIILQLMQERPY